MYRSLAILLVLSFDLVSPTYAQYNSKDARKLVNDSISAMGGIERLRAIRFIHTHSVGHFYMVEQSERPEGPWLSINQATEEWRDVENGKIRRRYEQTGVQPGKASELVADGISLVDYGNGFVSNPNNIPPTEELLAMAPERILLNALSASDLRYSGEEILQGRMNDIITFTWKNSPVKIYLNRDTDLMTMTDVVKARPTEMFWGMWGDFSEKNYYSFWNLEKGGFHYPQQIDTFYNGQPLRMDTVTDIEFNTEPPKDTFAISDKEKADYTKASKATFPEMALGRADRPPVDIAPGFTAIRGNWNVTLVKQDDGIVIIEAPISSNYSVQVIAEVKKRYPNQKIKAVISTSDAFPHFGGVREYVAAGIPVYILDLNQPIINRLISANYRTFPDNLERNPARKRSKLNIVDKKTVLGSGANQLELYPIRTETGERMIMIYAPHLKVLYGADLLQPLPTGGFFMPQYISELRDAAAREKLEVERVFAIHSSPLEWKKVLEALNDSEK